MKSIIRFAIFTIAVITLACNPSSKSSNYTAPIASIVTRTHKTHTEVSKQLDTRTPDELTQAACLGANGQWRCSSNHKTVFAATSNNSPIIPSSWSVPNWYVDPSNATGCASDNNSGTSSTCGTSGIGPLKTFQELNVHRWGCIGNPVECPRIRQNTTITYLSSNTDDSDPVYLAPAIEHQAEFLVQGQLTSSQQICSTTLGVVTAKNRNTPQLLKTTFTSCASAAAGQIVVNATHSSRAWIYNSAGGGAWNISQPLTPAVPFGNTPTEVDTWASGDTVTVYQPTQVDIADVRPILIGYNQSTFLNELNLYQLTIYSPSGATNDNVYISANTYAWEVGSQKYIILQPTGSDSVVTLGNVFNSGGLEVKGVSQLTNFVTAGVLEGIIPSFGASQLDNDVIVDTGASTITGPSYLGNVYLETNTILSSSASTQVASSAIVWGPGTLNAIGSSRIYYGSGAGKAAATFINSGGLQLNGQLLGCITKPSSSTITCNTSNTAANLDSNLGATSGCIGTINGGAFCNYGP